MNNANTNNITSVIEKFIQGDIMFTAYDVTKMVRSNNLHVMHDTVKSVLDSYNWRRTYTRTLNKQLGAYIYHAPMSNPDNYSPSSIPNILFTPNVGVSGVTGPTGIVGTPLNIVAQGTGGKSVVFDLFDKRGRYTISRSHIRDAGFVPFTYVQFNIVGNRIVITKELDKTKKHATVDSKYNIRVVRNMFMKAFNRIPTQSELKISTSKNTIMLFV